jgi:hypothetical protein
MESENLSSSLAAHTPWSLSSRENGFLEMRIPSRQLGFDCARKRNTVQDNRGVVVGDPISCAARRGSGEGYFISNAFL